MEQTLTRPGLTLADRCDRCGAQAFVQAKLRSGTLLFCNHHGREYGPALIVQQAEITSDEIVQRVNDTDH